jgi:hypothetical protein
VAAAAAVSRRRADGGVGAFGLVRAVRANVAQLRRGSCEERPRLGVATEGEQALGELLEHVAVGLPERVELREERPLCRERLLDVAAGAQAAGDRPACDPRPILASVGEEGVARELE